MSQYKLRKNEKKNRQKAIVITTFFYLSLVGGIFAYGNGVEVSKYLPEQVKEWLDLDHQPEVVKDDTRA